MRLKFIKKLELEFEAWGSCSETFDFAYGCVADGHYIWGGRLAYMLLYLFAEERVRGD